LTLAVPDFSPVLAAALSAAAASTFDRLGFIELFAIYFPSRQLPAYGCLSVSPIYSQTVAAWFTAHTNAESVAQQASLECIGGSAEFQFEGELAQLMEYLG
jgi:hypothetical protein